MERIAYTVAEAIEALGIGRTTLNAAIGSGELKTRKLGRRTLILARDLDAWLGALPDALDADKADEARNG